MMDPATFLLGVVLGFLLGFFIATVAVRKALYSIKAKTADTPDTDPRP